jgi:NTE family protein
MTRAVVLGGGGPVGIGWEAGLLVGLARNGVDIGQADAVVGTSAGSVVGMTLASGGDLTEAVNLVHGVKGVAADDPAVAGAAQGLEQLISAVSEAAQNPDRAEAARAWLGRLAEEAPTISEDSWLSMFDFFAGAEWPERFSCTAVGTADGQFKVWTGSDGVDVQHAVASSCAVPCVFPPVAISGRRWMDGGVRDMVNADVAAGHSRVLVVSCTLLDVPEGLAMPALDAMFAATRGQIDGLRDGGSQVEVIVPGAEMLEVSGWGMNLMDFGQAGAAYDAGLRQGDEEAGRLKQFWMG